LLNWTDSENELSVDEDRVKEQRLRFLKNLNKFADETPVEQK